MWKTCRRLESKVLTSWTPYVDRILSKTGMPIAPNGRIARTSDGMEDMDAFFAGNPASIPPLQRAKRISQILEEQEEYEDEEEQNQTANYNGRGSVSAATSRRTVVEEEEEYEEVSEEEEDQVLSGDEEQYDNEEYDQSRSNTSGVSTVHRGRRQSGRSDIYDVEASLVDGDQYDDYGEDDGGTKSMSLEGSKRTSFWQVP